MKTTASLILAIIFLTSVSAVAQTEKPQMQTLFGENPIAWGGYGGPRVAYSTVSDKGMWLIGGRGGAIVNRSFVFGGAGYGIVNSPIFKNIEYNGQTWGKAYLEGGYGGFYMEYILKPHRILHFSFPLIIGAGNLLFSDVQHINAGHNFNKHIIANSAFFVVEPGAELELNVLPILRFSAGVAYRYANGLNMPSISANGFNSLVVAISIKFGNF